MGHTRWATHGVPSDGNAHPQTDMTGRVAVVHNGIIENAHELRVQLEARGVVFASETDTEVLAQLIAAVETDSLEEAVRTALRSITGTYGIAVMDARHPEQIVVARNGSPVILGIGDKEMFVASDASALVRHTQQAIYLDDGEIAVVEARAYRVTTLDAAPATKQPTTLAIVDDHMSKGSFSHFTMKEIHEQPDSVRGTLRGRLDRRFATARLDGLNLTPRELLRFRRIKILGCGSACISGFLGARMIERLSRIPCDAESAAEFRYRNPVIEDDTLYVAVSQSGETFDTLAAVDEIKRKGGAVVGDHQRGRQHHRARMRTRRVPARGSRGRRRIDQDVHVDAGRVRVARAAPRAHEGRLGRRRAPSDRRARPVAGAARGADRRSGRPRGAREEVRALHERLLRRSQRRLCARDGRAR